MNVRHANFTTIDDFTRSIAEALQQGQEPVLSISCLPFYTGKKAAFGFVQLVQSVPFKWIDKMPEGTIHITMEDVNWTEGSVNHDHAVVIGGGSMKNGEKTIFIKDSNFGKIWSADSIDVLIPPKARAAAEVRDVQCDLVLLLPFVTQTTG
jgi:hypothetical protein